MPFEQHFPSSHSTLLDALYRGVIFTAPSHPASEHLVELVREAILQSFPEVHDLDALIHARHPTSPALFFERITALRAKLTTAPRIRRQLHAVMMALGFSPADHCADVLRLRAVPHDGHLIPEAAAAYFAHRDTWYGNPQAQINWWIPLVDVTPDTSFGLFPGFFQQPIQNDSSAFDYHHFMQAVGWQNYKTGPKPTYPRALAGTGPPTRFELRAGEILLFSAAHLHATLPNTSGTTRFSVDFRTVHRADHAAGNGAPNVDCRCTGSAFDDYA